MNEGETSVKYIRVRCVSSAVISLVDAKLITDCGVAVS